MSSDQTVTSLLNMQVYALFTSTPFAPAASTSARISHTVSGVGGGGRGRSTTSAARVPCVGPPFLAPRAACCRREEKYAHAAPLARWLRGIGILGIFFHALPLLIGLKLIERGLCCHGLRLQRCGLCFSGTRCCNKRLGCQLFGCASLGCFLLSDIRLLHSQLDLLFSKLESCGMPLIRLLCFVLEPPSLCQRIAAAPVVRLQRALHHDRRGFRRYTQHAWISATL